MVEVHLTDFNNINITKTNEKDKSLVHIVVPAQGKKSLPNSNNKEGSLQLLGTPWMTSFGLS